MQNGKPVSTPFTGHFSLSARECPSMEEEMPKIPYANVVGCLINAMVCIRPNIAQAFGVLSMYMANLGK